MNVPRKRRFPMRPRPLVISLLGYRGDGYKQSSKLIAQLRAEVAARRDNQSDPEN